MTQTSSLPPKRLSVNFIWASGGRVFYSLTQWLLIVVIARLGSAATLGEFSLGMAITTPVFMFASLRLPMLLATDADTKFSFKTYFSLAVLMAVIGILLCFVLAMLLNYDSVIVVVVGVMALVKSLELMSEVNFAVLQKNEHMREISLSLAIRGLLSLIGFAVVFYSTHNLVLALVSLVVVRIALLFLLDARNARPFIALMNNEPLNGAVKGALRVLFWLSLPLGCAVLIDSLLAIVPRFLVEGFLGVEILGYFTALTSLLFIGGTVVLAVNQVVIPRLSKYYANQQYTAFEKLLWLAIAIVAAISVIGLVIVYFYGEEILKLVYGEPFGHYSNILWWLVLTTIIGFPATILNGVLTSMRQVKIQPFIALCALVVGVLVIYLTIQNHQLLGVTWGIMSSWLVMLFGNLFCTYRSLNSARMAQAESA